MIKYTLDEKARVGDILPYEEKVRRTKLFFKYVPQIKPYVPLY